MVSVQEKKEWRAICLSIIRTGCSITQLSECLDKNYAKIRLNISKAIVLGIVSDEEADILISRICHNDKINVKTEKYYDYILELRASRKKLIRRQNFLKSFFELKNNIPENEKEKLKIRLGNLQEEIDAFERSSIYTTNKKL